MGNGRRAYDILRGYIGREYDRLQGLDRASAEDELRKAMTDPSVRSNPSVTNVPEPTDARADSMERAARVLGVESNAGFDEVRAAYEKLSKKILPSQFPAGSEERRQVAEIQRRIQWAYQTLTENVDAVEKRFRSLEIE
jgi:hypothetical protein